MAADVSGIVDAVLAVDLDEERRERNRVEAEFRAHLDTIANEIREGR